MMLFSKLNKQFKGFLEAVSDEISNPFEIKLLNLIRKHFEAIANCGTAGGKRGLLINELILKEGNTISDSLKITNEETSIVNSSPLQQLVTLHVQSFRGFSEVCIFKLDKPHILVYGANGSGKSSFCEALEYCLLGYINEASHKKIGVQDYIKNIYLGLSQPPLLKAVNTEGELIEVVADYDQFHFSFLEKNRIDSFARLSSFTPANQTELLAVLFGLDDFNEFVKQFTENIQNYVLTESETEKIYRLKAIEIDGHKKNKVQYQLDLEALKNKEELIAAESKLEKSFVELDNYINGSQSFVGRLKEIQELLQKGTPPKLEIKSINELIQSLKHLQQNELVKYKADQDRYLTKTDEINLSSLYNALANIDESLTDICPACETPLSGVTKNPFKNAREKLGDLKMIADLQNSKTESFKKLVQSITAFVNDVQLFIGALKILDRNIGIILPKELQELPSISKSEEYIQKLEQFILMFLSKEPDLKDAQQLIDERNQLSFKEKETKQELINEQNKLTNLNHKITALNAERNKLQELISKIDSSIINFEEANEITLKAIEEEKKQININLQFINAYRSFREKLINYKDKLPLTLVENLNDKTREFYNEINSDDATFELLAKVKLPSRAMEAIQVSFQDNPTKFYNALHVLSEGHIKCLGLSILLAKCVSSDVKILIFDDVVNAIDDDHRGKISQLLFKNPHFSGKQIIITSHSEEFIKDVENLMFHKDDYEKLVGKIIFDRRIEKRIQYFESPSHYLKKAENYLILSSKRDCLSNIRRSLESISELIWKKLITFEKSKYNVEISLKLRHPSKKPDLMNVVSGIRKCTDTINSERLKNLNELLKWFEGIETKHPRIWEFLNKGTHEETDRDDFDNSVVKVILEKAIELEKLSKEKW